MDPPTLVPSFDFDHSSFWAPCFATFGHFSTFHGIACYHLACSRGWLQHRSKVICSRDWYILSCQSPINEHLPVEIKGTKKNNEETNSTNAADSVHPFDMLWVGLPLEFQHPGRVPFPPAVAFHDIPQEEQSSQELLKGTDRLSIMQHLLNIHLCI